jgi:glyoxylate utilization-related uncharacterized protein
MTPTPSAPQLIRGSEVEYIDIGTGWLLSRCVTDTGLLAFGGGFVETIEAGVNLKDWTVQYDETVFVHAGEVRLICDGDEHVAGPGDVLVIPKGSTITFVTTLGTKAHFTLFPRDWEAHASDSAEARFITGLVQQAG